MMTLYLLGGLVLLMLVIALLIYRNRAEQLKHKNEILNTINTAVSQTNRHRTDLDKRLNALHEAQRNETIEDNGHLAERGDFDNDWSNDGLSGADAGVGAAVGGAESSGTTGSAVDSGGRTGLSE
ncbi:hypothetical protein [Methylobacter sp.]|uniref:hypothetical protein n=1 Tax=Methylobacter sp. TaxID=2051955 RepID=UPI002487739A|nr:hypothetical protein [Methylobacter sp.]MDI1278036.1 hypothetical protein [Methylobacter sp.]